MSRTLAAIEADLHIEQPSLDRPTDMQARAMRAVESGDRAAIARIATRTRWALLDKKWIEHNNSIRGYELTAGGRAALERY
jgi:hypothetical protein